MATSFAVARRIARPLERLAQLESELHLLKQQMHPHFLFNILNNVGAMIPLEPERATEMIAKLSELYRRILSSSKISTSRLASELAVVRDFLDLQKMRFGDRLHYAIAAPEHALSLHVPSLLVQTLVENAVKHGVEKSREGGDIRVSIDGDGKNWICEISNSGAPFREDARQGDGGGTGLENTRKRLKLLYGKVGTFEIGRAPDGRTVARFGFTGEEK
jgi:LytS/YehU family sensor histidine kinase